MYIPASYAETDTATLHAFIEQHSFGLLISQLDGEPFATHLPLLLERQTGPHGCLVGHMARANPQWRRAAGRPVLAVFSGPHTYISPTWYAAEDVVPTWNYVAVHAAGPLHVIEEPPAILEIVGRSVELYERAMPQPWRLDESGPQTEHLLSQIVGFRIPIERLEGKWKLNQNHPEERRARVARALRAQADENSQAIATLMERAK